MLGVMSHPDKTTLLNIISELNKFSRGTITINGVNITSLSEEKLAKFKLENIEIMFQFYNLMPTPSAVENFELPLALLTALGAERRTKALSLLKELELMHGACIKSNELSDGKRQRVAMVEKYLKF